MEKESDPIKESESGERTHDETKTKERQERRRSEQQHLPPQHNMQYYEQQQQQQQQLSSQAAYYDYDYQQYTYLNAQHQWYMSQHLLHPEYRR